MTSDCGHAQHRDCKVHDFYVKSAKTTFANEDGSDPELFDTIVVCAKGPDIHNDVETEIHVNLVFPATVIPGLIAELAQHLHDLPEAEHIGGVKV